MQERETNEDNFLCSCGLDCLFVVGNVAWEMDGLCVLVILSMQTLTLWRKDAAQSRVNRPAETKLSLTTDEYEIWGRIRECIVETFSYRFKNDKNLEIVRKIQ